jgi:hypothetical protein
MTDMTDGGAFLGIILATLRGLLGVRAIRPKLKVVVAGHRESDRILWVWVRATNEGGAAITIDTVSSWVKGPGHIEKIKFKSGPRVPFRLDSYSSAEWESKIKVRDRRMTKNVACTAFISGGGMSAYRERKITNR